MRILLFFTLFAFVSCGTQTKIVSSWKDPNTAIDPDRLSKVMVAVLAPDETIRRRAEDKMATLHPAFFQSYQIFESPDEAKDENRAKVILRDADFDGVIILKLVKIEEKETYMPGNMRRTAYWNQHGIFFTKYYTPGYYLRDQDYFLSTNVFSLTHDKLLWSGITSTLNPATIEGTIEEVINEVARQMKKDGFIARR
ncbi:MAG: hypothetical protein K0B09_05785 [Bacteroidales bacterium]|nr:hypothetical protein [Bacteroidales bacterium]